MTFRSLAFLFLTLAGPAVASPVGLTTSPDGSRLFIAMEDPPSVKVVASSSGEITDTWPLTSKPRDIAISPDGAQLYLPAAIAPGRLLTLDTATGGLSGSVPSGHSPRSATPSTDGSLVFICNQFENRIEVFDTRAKRMVANHPAIREPVASALRPDGLALFVANLLPAGPANTGDIAAEVSVIDLPHGEALSIRLPNGSMDARALAISPDGRFAYVAHTLARYSLPTTQLDRGWMNTSALSVIDAKQPRHITTVLLDDIDLGAANPSGIACSPDGLMLAVIHAGTHEISIIDRIAFHERIERASKGEQVTSICKSLKDIPNDLSFLHGIRRRIKLSGNGPRSVTTTPHGFAVTCYFSNTLHLVDVGAAVTVRDIPLAPPRKETPARAGERMFFDATRCFQHWQSCSTCHPEVRTDALNWDLLNDGIGNPKQTKNMLFSIQTPPAMISGIRPNAETAIRAGMRYIQFVVHPEEDALAIEAFFHSLKPVPGPALVDGKLSAAGQRGKEVFDLALCSACHSGPYLTDGKRHMVNTGLRRESGKAWDTPGLREIWRTAPYLHDGRAATLEDVIGSANPGDKHGRTSSLNSQQRGDLIEYLRSL